MGIVRGGNKLKFINEIPTGDTRMFRNCDLARCEIQTEDMGTPPNRASLILTLYWQGRFGAVSRRGICHIWFRGRQISPSMPYREARSVAESSEGPTASKSDRTGRNPGMNRLVRRSSAGVWRYCVFLSCSNIPSAHAQMFWLFDTYPTQKH